MPRFSVLVLALLALSAALAPLPTVHAGDAPPRPTLTIDGDWDVTGLELHTGEDILVRGNVNVTGTLDLTAGALRLEEPTDLERGLTVKSGGTLILSGTVLEPTTSDKHLWVRAEAGSRVLVRNASLNRLGGAIPGLEGFRTYADNATFEGSTFSDYFTAIAVRGGRGVRLLNNSFLDSRGEPEGHAVEVRGARDVRIDGNLFRPATDTGALEVASPGNAITRNRFELLPGSSARRPVYLSYDYGAGQAADRTVFEQNSLLGTGVHLNAVADTVVRNNTIDPTGSQRPFGIQAFVQIGTPPGTWSRNLTIEGNAIANFTQYAIRLEQNISHSAVRGNIIRDPVGRPSGEAYGIYLIRALHNITVAGNVIDMAPPAGDITTFGISLESQVNDCRIEGNLIRDASQVAVNIQGDNVGTPMPAYHNGPSLRNIVANNTIELTRPILQTSDVISAMVTWVWANHTVIEDNTVRNYTLANNASVYNGAFLQTSSSLQRVRGNTIEGARWGVVFKRVGSGHEQTAFGEFNRSANVVHGNTLLGIEREMIVNDESDGFGPIRNVVLMATDRLVGGLPELHYEAMGSIPSLAWESDGRFFTAAMRATDPVSGGDTSLITSLPHAGPPLSWSVAGGLNASGSRGVGVVLRRASLLEWDYRVDTVAPTRHAHSLEVRSRYNLTLSHSGGWSNDTVDTRADGRGGFGTGTSGVMDVRLLLNRTLDDGPEVLHAVRIETGPPGLPVIVENISYTSPYAESWPSSRTGWIEVHPIQEETRDIRWRWASWSDGGDRAHLAGLNRSASQVDVAGRTASALTYTGGSYATFLFSATSRYAETPEAAPPDHFSWTWTFPPSSDLDFGVFFDPACAGSYTAADLVGSAATAANPEKLLLSRPASGCYWVHAVAFNGPADVAFDQRRESALGQPTVLSATYVREYRIRLGSTEPGLVLIVDGGPMKPPVELWWEEGITHTLSAPESAPGVRFAGWSDGGPQERTVTATGPATFVATYSSVLFLPAVLAIAIMAGIMLGILVYRRRRRPGRPREPPPEA